jgi:hypothetical protein
LLRRTGAASLARIGAFVGAVLLASTTRALQAPESKPRLVPGVPLAVQIPASVEHATVFRVEVPDEATGLWLQALGADVDVEIDAAFEQSPDSPEARISSNLWIDEQLLIERSDGLPLATGTWQVRVHGVDAGFGSEPHAGSCTLLARLIVPEPRELAYGRLEELSLEREQGLRAVFHPVVPPELRGDVLIEAFSPLADIELLVGPVDARRTLVQPYARSERLLSYELLRIDAERLRAGSAIHVYAHSDLEGLDAIPLRVVLRALDAAEPRALLQPPLPRPETLGPFGTAIAASVVIFGPLGSGSGVVVHESGLVLTNAHVISGARGGGALDLALGFTTDPAAPPIPCYAGELVDYRPDLDLALLRLSGWIDGRPLAKDARFPACALQFDAPPALGERIVVLGYPMTGGASSMVPLSLTAGVMSGWALEPAGRVLKTDAAIHAGVSGGTCLDGGGRLIGLPTSSLADSNYAGGLGFVIPLERLPAAWRARCGPQKP